HGQVEIAELLLDRGADLEAVDGSAFTPLLISCMSNQKDIVTLLAHRGANLRAEHPAFGRAIVLGYWQECINGKSGLTEFMMSQGVPFDPNTSFMGVTMLNLASTFKNTDMARFVIALGADVNAFSDGRGKTELGFATQCGATEIVDILIAKGASLDAADSNGDPPIRAAVEKGYLDIVRALLGAGAKIDFVEKENARTLLHMSAQRGYGEITAELVAGGLDVNAADDDGNTPVYYAGKYGHKRIVDLLAENGARSPADMPQNFGGPAEFTGSLGEKEAVIRCLLHRGWTLKTKDHLLVFDAEEFGAARPDEPSLTNGCLVPSELKAQNVVSIYSTYHGRPGEPAYIHEIEDSLEQVIYIQSKLDPWEGCKNTVYLGPGENGIHGGVELFPFMITESNPALAYFIKVDGLTIFYPGWPPEDFERFKRDLQGLKDQVGRVDIAFLPASQSEGDNAVARYCMEQLNPRLVVPFHSSRRMPPYLRLAGEIAEWGYDAAVFCAENPGDHFEFSPR
ncbi:MAG: ankyrin repeat domain-containing protein, partial [Candidatus Zixiibacteriota bacterium]